MGKKKTSFLLILAVMVVLCCVAWEIGRLVLPRIAYQQSLLPRCESNKLPTGFEKDLIGTWEAGSPGNSDTLILRSDHQYQQLIRRYGNQYYSDVNYEGNWQSWWIEYKTNGIPYLHLAGMRLCAIEPLISCATSGGSGFDFCDNEFVQMKEEGILLILSVRPTTHPTSPPEIELFFPEGTDETWVYTRQIP